MLAFLGPFIDQTLLSISALLLIRLIPANADESLVVDTTSPHTSLPVVGTVLLLSAVVVMHHQSFNSSQGPSAKTEPMMADPSMSIDDLLAFIGEDSSSAPSKKTKTKKKIKASKRIEKETAKKLAEKQIQDRTNLEPATSLQHCTKTPSEKGTGIRLKPKVNSSQQQSSTFRRHSTPPRPTKHQVNQQQVPRPPLAKTTKQQSAEQQQQREDTVSKNHHLLNTPSDDGRRRRLSSPSSASKQQQQQQEHVVVRPPSKKIQQEHLVGPATVVPKSSSYPATTKAMIPRRRASTSSPCGRDAIIMPKPSPSGTHSGVFVHGRRVSAPPGFEGLVPSPRPSSPTAHSCRPNDDPAPLSPCSTSVSSSWCGSTAASGSSSSSSHASSCCKTPPPLPSRSDARVPPGFAPLSEKAKTTTPQTITKHDDPVVDVAVVVDSDLSPEAAPFVPSSSSSSSSSRPLVSHHHHHNHRSNSLPPEYLYLPRMLQQDNDDNDDVDDDIKSRRTILSFSPIHSAAAAAAATEVIEEDLNELGRSMVFSILD